MEDDFQSLSKGVFVVPFNPATVAGAGPSRPTRPLKRVYDETFRRCQHAHLAYEKERMEEQLDDIADWLDACNAPPLIKRVTGTKRIRIALMQNISEALPDHLSTLAKNAFTLQAKDAADLISATRNIAASDSRKSGKTEIEGLEAWYEANKNNHPLLLHISQAQLIPPNVLSELLYILAIHHDLPFRVLLSVSSTALFLSSWSHVEPSLVDLTVIQAGRGRKRGAAVTAMLKTSSDGRRMPLTLTEDLAEEIRKAEDMTGGGAAAALKALKWSLLQHSFNSFLAHADESQLQDVQAVVEAVHGGKLDVPGRRILQVDSHPDLAAALDPASRLSILHALSHPAAFRSDESKNEEREATPTPQTQAVAVGPLSDSQHKRRRGASSAPGDGPVEQDIGGGDLRELETMFGLWRSAGRNVNLWDWLDGFRGAMTATEEDAPEKGPNGESNGGDGAETPMNGLGDNESEAPSAAVDQVTAEDAPGTDTATVEAGDAETQDRLHAAFVRFCEEARMLGLVRARGGRTSRRADEVVKGIGLV